MQWKSLDAVHQADKYFICIYAKHGKLCTRALSKRFTGLDYFYAIFNALAAIAWQIYGNFEAFYASYFEYAYILSSIWKTWFELYSVKVFEFDSILKVTIYKGRAQYRRKFFAGDFATFGNMKTDSVRQK